MSNQRPPGGIEGPTEDPERERQSGGQPDAPRPWIDPNRTQRYSGRRSIVDRLRGESRAPETLAPAESPPAPPPWQGIRPQISASAQVRSARASGGRRFAAILGGVVALGLAGGAAAAWFSGWRPAFLGGAGTEEPAKPPADRQVEPPAESKPGAKPGEPEKPGAASPPGEIARSCFVGHTEVKAGASACGFALDPAGALGFQGSRVTERLAAGGGPAQRIILYPFAPSGRFVFLRACESASGGRCAVQRLVDTKAGKIFEVKGGTDGFNWVAWSPTETAGLLGYRDGLSETIAIIATADGRSRRASAIRTAKNRYALVRANSVRWRDEESFSVEVKLCPVAKGRARNTECEKDDDVRYRRRTVKFER